MVLLSGNHAFSTGVFLQGALYVQFKASVHQFLLVSLPPVLMGYWYAEEPMNIATSKEDYYHKRYQFAKGRQDTWARNLVC